MLGKHPLVDTVGYSLQIEFTTHLLFPRKHTHIKIYSFTFHFKEEETRLASTESEELDFLWRCISVIRKVLKMNEMNYPIYSRISRSPKFESKFCLKAALTLAALDT